MPAEDLVILLDLVEFPDKHSRLKRQIIQRIGAIPGGDWFGGPDAAALVGKSRGWCGQVLAKLDADRIIIRHGTEANSRKIWCEVNPDWEQWRGMAWRETRQTIRERLAYVRQRRQTDPLVRFMDFSGHSHPRYTHLTRVIGGRKRDEAQNGAGGGQHRVLLEAENAVTAFSGTPIAFSDPFYTRSGGEGRGSYPQENAIAERLHTLLLGSLSSRENRPSLSLEEGPRDQEREQGQQQRQWTGDDNVELVIEAIENRTDGIVFGVLKRERIPADVTKWGAAAMLQAIAELEPQGPSETPPFYVTRLEKCLREGQRRSEQDARAEAERPLREELNELREGLAQLHHMGMTSSDVDHARYKQLCEQLGEAPDLPLFIVEPPVWETTAPTHPDHPLVGDWAQRKARMRQQDKTETDPD